MLCVPSKAPSISFWLASMTLRGPQQGKRAQRVLLAVMCMHDGCAVVANYQHHKRAASDSRPASQTCRQPGPGVAWLQWWVGCPLLHHPSRSESCLNIHAGWSSYSDHPAGKLRLVVFLPFCLEDAWTPQVSNGRFELPVSDYHGCSNKYVAPEEK